MATADFSRLRAGQPDCPSDLILDRLATSELTEEKAATTRAHVAGCAECTSRMAQRSFTGLAVDERLMLAGIRRGLERPAGLGDRARAWLGRLTVPLASLTGLAAVLLLVRPLLPGDGGGHPEQPPRLGAVGAPGSDVRFKGGLALHVYRQVRGATGSEEVASGGRFAAGDALRFVVDLPSAGHVSVIGVESGGALYTAWPRGDKAQTQRPAGAGQELPGAVMLDAAPGQETLYLVHCSPSAGTPQCQPGDAGAPRCQRGCASTSFLVNKGR